MSQANRRASNGASHEKPSFGIAACIVEEEGKASGLPATESSADRVVSRRGASGSAATLHVHEMDVATMTRPKHHQPQAVGLLTSALREYKRVSGLRPAQRVDRVRWHERSRQRGPGWRGQATSPTSHDEIAAFHTPVRSTFCVQSLARCSNRCKLPFFCIHCRLKRVPDRPRSSSTNWKNPGRDAALPDISRYRDRDDR